jgi:hypothetical protein
VSDIDTVVVDSLKALDPEWPIREADIVDAFSHFRFVRGTHVPVEEPSTASKADIYEVTRSPRRRAIPSMAAQ